MAKFVLEDDRDGNNRLELKAKTYKEALEEALEFLGYSVLEKV